MALVECSVCGSKATIRSSRKISNLSREMYCQCNDPFCGHSFAAILQITKTISKPAKEPNDVQPLPLFELSEPPAGLQRHA